MKLKSDHRSIVSNWKEEAWKYQGSNGIRMCGFTAQLVERRTGVAEVTGSYPVEAMKFSGFFLLTA